MIKRDIFLLVLFIFNITNSFYINGGCCGNSCRGADTSKGEINNNNQSKQKNKNIIPTGNPPLKNIPGNIIPIPNGQYSGNPTLNNNPSDRLDINPDTKINEKLINNNVQEQKKGTSKPGLIGLKNVGATCYMNATLQCFSNSSIFRSQLLNKYKELESNKDGKCKLSFAFAEVLKNLWKNLDHKSYTPENFKNVISELNPLFKGIAANDAKDLVLFLLERIHNELNSPINNHFNNNNKEPNVSNFYEVYNNFANDYTSKNKSIISDEFYGYTNSCTTCGYCNTNIHNVQIMNILFFPLEEVRKFKQYNNNCVSIENCFEYYEKTEIFPSFYCNYCKQNYQAYNGNKIVYSPKTLIINLNRGRGMEYNVNIVFGEYLDLRKFVFMKDSPYYYELIGVVSHFGNNDEGGHFIAYCKNSEDCEWYKFNDEIVEKSNLEEVKSMGMPYVLFYRYCKTQE